MKFINYEVHIARARFSHCYKNTYVQLDGCSDVCYYNICADENRKLEKNKFT